MTRKLPLNGFVHADKAVHFSAFVLWYALAFSEWLTSRSSKKAKRWSISLAFLAVLIALLVEWLQGWLTVHRSMEMADFVAGAFGVFLSILICRWMPVEQIWRSNRVK